MPSAYPSLDPPAVFWACGLGFGLGLIGLLSSVWGRQAKCMIEQHKSDNLWSFWALECPFWG